MTWFACGNLTHMLKTLVKIQRPLLKLRKSIFPQGKSNDTNIILLRVTKRPTIRQNETHFSDQSSIKFSEREQMNKKKESHKYLPIIWSFLVTSQKRSNKCTISTTAEVGSRRSDNGCFPLPSIFQRWSLNSIFFCASTFQMMPSQIPFLLFSSRLFIFAFPFKSV